MTRRGYLLFLEDILLAMDKIEKYTNNISQEEFKNKDIVIDAVIRNLEVIGEAAKSIPVEAREEYPHIPWKRMIGLRNIMIHDYFGIDLSIVWTIVRTNLPEARKDIENMLSKIKRAATRE
jgi:uncharacterized protein with HEPN domain